MVYHRIVKLKYSPAATAADLGSRGISISHETIYQAIYRRFFGDPRIVLCRPRKTRRRRTKTGRGPNSLGDFVLIDERPERVGAGHWEADLLSGTGNKSVVGVLTETVSRQTIVVSLPQRSTRHVADQLVGIIQHRIPKHLRKTLTLDQGREFARWDRIGKATGFAIYFCHPRSPWEKPLVEQTTACYADGSPNTLTCQKTKKPSTRSTSSSTTCHDEASTGNDPQTCIVNYALQQPLELTPSTDLSVCPPASVPGRFLGYRDSGIAIPRPQSAIRNPQSSSCLCRISVVGIRVFAGSSMAVMIATAYFRVYLPSVRVGGLPRIAI